MSLLGFPHDLTREVGFFRRPEQPAAPRTFPFPLIVFTYNILHFEDLRILSLQLLRGTQTSSEAPTLALFGRVFGFAAGQYRVEKGLLFAFLPFGSVRFQLLLVVGPASFPPKLWI